MSSAESSAGTLPAVDDRLVAPNTQYEIDDGKLVRVSPCDPPRGERNSKLAALLEAFVSDPFKVAVDMLTRLSENTDIAPDASVFPRAPDPRTGGRQIEQLVFEIVSTERLNHAAHRAARLVARGVRRVFVIDVERERVFEWSRDLGTLEMLDLGGVLVDPALVTPLPIAALASTDKADDLVAHALQEKGNPVLLAAIAQGVARGRAEALLAVLVARGFTPTAMQRTRILGETALALLDRWLVVAVTCANIDELLDA